MSDQETPVSAKPHPWYGPCDGFMDDGCSECYRNKPATREEIEGWARRYQLDYPAFDINRIALSLDAAEARALEAERLAESWHQAHDSWKETAEGNERIIEAMCKEGCAAAKMLIDAAMWAVKNYDEWVDAPEAGKLAAWQILGHSIGPLRAALAAIDAAREQRDA